MAETRTLWNSPRLAIVLCAFAFFGILGNRSLNEPDEGRYATIASTMVETGDWLVPKLWYMPHLDKPPMTYWAVAASLSVFGHNERAVRIPLALAGVSGLCAAVLLATAMGGGVLGIRTAIILSSSVLYFAMSRMLTTDIFLTQFVMWAIYGWWRAWNSAFKQPKMSIAWQMFAWLFMALGFLTKGPLALAIPFSGVIGLIAFRRSEKGRLRSLALGLPLGLFVFCIVALPWFLSVFRAVPGAFDFMVKGQVVGHALGTTVKNRHGHPLYYVAILLVGFLPWTVLAGNILRRNFWSQGGGTKREGAVMLASVCAFTFVLFSCMSSKLPAYILPMFPCLAILVAMLLVRTDLSSFRFAARTGLILCWSLFLAWPIVAWAAFGVKNVPWIIAQSGIALALMCAGWFASRSWSVEKITAISSAWAVVGMLIVVAEVPMLETQLRSNQTLKPLGQALIKNYREGDKVVVYGRLPQGLPFYSSPAICATNRPYLANLPEHIVPFEFTANRTSLGSLLIPDDAALAAFIQKQKRVLLVGFEGTSDHLGRSLPQIHLQLQTRVGKWELIACTPQK